MASEDGRHRPERIGIFIGGMRCGSTVTLDYMKQHPQICCHEKKDPHFFSSDDNWNNGWESYLSGWRAYDPKRHLIAFESSTHYTKYPLYPKTASRMAQTYRDIRLIYGVRGPISRVESHLVHNAGKGYLDPSNQAERERLLQQAINVSNYELQISQFERFFPPEKILVVNLADLVSTTKRTLAEIFRFLGVDSGIDVTEIPVRPRRFKYDTSSIALSEQERQHVASELLEATRRFEERYSVRVWDGDG